MHVNITYQAPTLFTLNASGINTLWESSLQPLAIESANLKKSKNIVIGTITALKYF